MGLAMAGAAIASLAPSLLAAQQKDGRMNIVYIMTDDHAFQAISAYGHPLSRQAPTPNLDRLAAQGILFNRAYVENSLSTPSRACLMTGLYSHQNGQTMLSNVMDSTVTFVSELLHDGGYQTGMIGKWHMRCEPRGFDTCRILRDQGEYYNPGFKSADTKGQYVHEDGYATELITDHAIEFLEERDPSRPFALFVHHKAPHRNWLPAMQYLDLYEDIEFPMPETFYDDYSTRGAAMQEQRMRIDDDMTMVYDLKLYGWTGKRTIHDDYFDSMASAVPAELLDQWKQSYVEKNSKYDFENMTRDELVRWKYQRYVHDYLRVIRSVDDSVGEILDYLEKHNLMDNTMVVYTSDQGFYMGEHGWFDKRFMYEESYRTPLIISYPGSRDGTISETLVQNIDYAPTFLDLAGISQPDNMTGRSLVPVLKKEGRKPFRWRKYLYYHFYDHTDEHNVLRHDGVSDKRYKLIHFYDETGALPSYEEFYDLKADPEELTNVIDKPKYKRLVKKFSRKLEKMRRELGVTEY